MEQKGEIGSSQVNVRRRRGQIPRTAPDQRHVDIAPDAHGVLPCEVPRDERRDGAQQPAPLQAAVNRALSEEPSRSNRAPNNAGCVKDFLARAGVLIWLGIRAERGMRQCFSVWPSGNVRAYQTSGIFVKAQFMTAICTMADHMLATSCAENMVLGDTFM